MNAAIDTSESFAAPAAAPRPVRPFYWSVRRELWENRSLMIAPLVAAGIVLLALIYRAIVAPGDVQMLAAVPAERQAQVATVFFGAIAYAISIVVNITVFFYLLDALQGERKDRSVLFWKSMPVSDTTTVLSKLFTALVVAGAIVVIVAMATQLAALLITSVVLMIGGASPGPLWGAQLVQMVVALVYWQIAVALWYAPVAAWLLLVSSWAKRVTILWAALPPIAVVVFERLAVNTHYVQDMINHRLRDPVIAALAPRTRGAELAVGSEGIKSHGIPDRVFDAIDPVAFFSNPWLWAGVAVAAAFVAAAIWMRRYREPL